jgi:4-diphosphocytidyl-2-C-methyl-D-erythritol kinase
VQFSTLVRLGAARPGEPARAAGPLAAGIGTRFALTTIAWPVQFRRMRWWEDEAPLQVRNRPDVMDFCRVGSALRVDTPAKLNLFLEVLAKRTDGFHEIETLMTAISICDTLLVTGNTEGRIRLSCSWASGIESRFEPPLVGPFGELPSETDNLVFRAADRLRVRAGVEAGASIRLVKRIPSAAGLGGASSDAAAALVALNDLWRLHWTRPQLARVASEVGSDVGFFLSDAGTGAWMATCRGRGERVEPEAGVPRLHFIVAKPPAGLSTSAVYRDCSVPPQPCRSDALRRALRRGDLAGAGRSLFNRLCETADRLCPWIGVVRRAFERSDLLGHQLSGSGTSYFGICRNGRHARHLAVRLRGLRIGEVYYATTTPAW